MNPIHLGSTDNQYGLPSHHGNEAEEPSSKQSPPCHSPMLYSALLLPTRQEKKPPQSTFSAPKTVQSILRHKMASKNPIMMSKDAISLPRFRALGGPTQERPNRSSFIRAYFRIRRDMTLEARTTSNFLEPSDAEARP